MGLIQIVVVLAVIGLILWAIGQIPMDPIIRKLITVVVVVFIVLWLLSAVGLFNGIGSIHIGRL